MCAALIGVTTALMPGQSGQTDWYATPISYLKAVQAAGGIPVLLPALLPEDDLASALARLDGLLLTGGGDIDPLLFGGLPHERVYGIEPERDRAEFFLVRRAVETGKPFLGICRGVQVVNTALGGGLFTDIADQLAGALKHDYFPNHPRNELAHAVQITPGSRLADIFGIDSLMVNSLHHQGLERIAPGLEITARAPDGLVEGVEVPGHPFGLAVQWHPEWLQEHALQRALFRAFTQACERMQAQA